MQSEAASSPSVTPRTNRGCVFFNFGGAYALRLLVAVFSLRRVYDGPVTVFLARDEEGRRLNPMLTDLGCEVIFIETAMTKSYDRHRLFSECSYETALVFDSDLIFLSPLDELFAATEEAGLLVTRFFAPPYGIEGKPEQRGWADRVAHLESIREFVDPDTYAAALERMIHQRIDVNVGVMGIAKPRGNRFLEEWSAAMERARGQEIVILDEMLTVALIASHQHHLADEAWNCPADEFFRRTNLADARIIHYFAEGHQVLDMTLGRNPSTWAGKKWFAMHELAARELDLEAWKKSDPAFG